MQSGFTYLGVLLWIGVSGAGLAAAGTVWQTVQQREKEQDLLFIGNQFRAAIQRYYDESPDPVKQFPRELKDLIQDHRRVGIRRYLRKIYRDPMTGREDWGLVQRLDGTIAGVYSLSVQAPIKRASFATADREFERARSYSDWKFVYRPTQQLAPSQKNNMP